MYIKPNVIVYSFWNYSLEKIDDNTSPDIKKVVDLREKILSMVDTLITEEEYSEMKKIICRTTASKFINTIDIFNLMFDVPSTCLLSEVDHLVTLGFLNENILTKPDIVKITYLMLEVQNRLLHTARNFFATASKSENEVEYIENMLEQLKKENSDYIKILEDVYHSWIDNTFTDDRVKKFMQEKSDIFIKEVIKMAIQILNIKKADKKRTIESYSHDKKAKFYYSKIDKQY